MATYQSRTHDSLLRRLIDAGIGTVLGTFVAIVLWVATIWLLFG